jgi:hypothetical protein
LEEPNGRTVQLGHLQQARHTISHRLDLRLVGREGNARHDILRFRLAIQFRGRAAKMNGGRDRALGAPADHDGLVRGQLDIGRPGKMIRVAGTGVALVGLLTRRTGGASRQVEEQTATTQQQNEPGVRR